MKGKRFNERGQAIVMIVFALVGLFGVTALSIDGGRLYYDRRRAQNAADTAALAASLANIQGQSWQTAALNQANTNGFNNDGVSNTVDVYLPPISGPYAGDSDYVQVFITATSGTSFVQFVFPGELTSTVEAVARSKVGGPPLAGNAIIGLGNCLAEGGEVIGVTGGGNSGGVVAVSGGMFVNTPEGSGNFCAISPPNNGYGIVAETAITSVGSHTYNGESLVSPTPITTGYNGGKPIDDPLYFLEEPTCSGPGTMEGGVYTPGSWNGGDFADGVLTAGIYCITGDIKLTSDDILYGDGVLLYFINGGMTFNGNGGLTITAPNDSNCLGTDGDTSASCTYKGIAVFAARDNTSTFGVRGNGGISIKGLIYAINGTVEARGGGKTADETNVEGQIISKRVLGNGNGSFEVIYNESYTYTMPPIIELTQ